MVTNTHMGTVVQINGGVQYTELKRITTDYFDAVGSGLSRGRRLESRDKRWAGVVVNESFARKFWTKESAVGQVFSMGGGTKQAEVVGLTRDTFDFALDTPPVPIVFTLMDDSSGSSGVEVNFILRLSDGYKIPDHLIQQELVHVNPNAIVSETNTISGRLAGSIKERSFVTLVLGFFSSAGIGVCVAGLLGIVGFVVARRTREIAIRSSIGASRRHITRIILAETVVAALIGQFGGFVAGWWILKSLESLIYGIEPGDWPTLAFASSLMLIVVVLSSWFPIRKALNLSPTIALQIE
jgi:putative ABC transport system permease protein